LLPRTAADAYAASPAGDPVTASEDEARDQPHDACLLPSQSLTVEVLRRSLGFAQYLAIRYTERLGEAGAVASVGSRGDSYDNALAESFNGLYKAELIRHEGPWRRLDDVELATLDYLDWFNHRRLHGELGMVPPEEYEAIHYHSAAPLAVSQ